MQQGIVMSHPPAPNRASDAPAGILSSFLNTDRVEEGVVSSSVRDVPAITQANGAMPRLHRLSRQGV
jgi:hypothetical protein